MQTLLDAQLAFVARVQDLVERRLEAAPETTRPLPSRSRWLLLRQVLILARFPRDDLPVPTRRSSRDNVSAPRGTTPSASLAPSVTVPPSPSARSRPHAE